MSWVGGHGYFTWGLFVSTTSRWTYWSHTYVCSTSTQSSHSVYGTEGGKVCFTYLYMLCMYVCMHVVRSHCTRDMKLEQEEHTEMGSQARAALWGNIFRFRDLPLHGGARSSQPFRLRGHFPSSIQSPQRSSSSSSSSSEKALSRRRSSVSCSDYCRTIAACIDKSR